VSANEEKINLLISALVEGLDNVAALSAELKQLDDAGNTNVPDNTRELREGAKKTADQLRNAGQGTEEWLSQLNNMKGELVLAAGALYGLQKTLGGAAGASSSFNQAMAEVSTLLDDTSSIEQMSEEVRKLSVEYGGDTNANAKALYDIISAGAEAGAEATEQLRVANQLAMGGVTDVKIAADGLTSTLNAYGEEAGDAANVSDAFFTAVKAGKTTVSELSGSIGTVAPLAKTAGVSLDELLSSVAALTAGGVSTSESMTQIKGALTSVIKPSKEATDLAAELGIEFNAAALQTKGWAGFLDEVKTATGGNVETMGKLFGSVEGLNGVLALTGEASDKFADTMDKMGEKTGATATAVEKMMDTPAARSARFQAALQGVNLAVGDAVTAFAPLLDSLTGLITQFTELEPGTRTAVAGIGALAVALPPAVLAVGSLAKAVGILRGAFIGSAAATTAQTAATTTATAATTAQTAATTTATAATTAATAATRALGVAMKSLPLVGLVASVGAAANALWEWSEAVDQADEATKRAEASEAKLQDRFERLSAETGVAITNIREYNQAKKDGIIIYDEATKRWVAAAVAQEELARQTRIAAAEQERQTQWAEAHAKTANEQAAAIVELGQATQRWTEALGGVDATADGAAGSVAKLLETAELADSIEFAGLLNGLDEIGRKTPELATLIEQELIKTIEKLDAKGLDNLSRSLQQAFDYGIISAEQFARQAGSIVEITAKRMGVDIAEALGRITPATKNALLNIDTLGKGLKTMGLTSQEQSKVISAAMQKAFASAKTQADIEALKAKMGELGQQGQLTAVDMAVLTEVTSGGMDSSADSTQKVIDKVVSLKREMAGLGSETEQTTEQVQQQADATGGAATAIANHLKVLREEFAEMGDAASAAFEEMLEKSVVAGESVHLFIGRFNDNIVKLRARLEDAKNMQESWADSAIERFTGMETASERQLKATERNIESMDMLDQTRLDAVRSQIDRLRQANEQLEQSLRSTLESLRDENDQMEDNRASIEERDYQRKREELQQQLEQARQAGNQQARQDAEEALRLLEQVHRRKLEQIAEEKQARAQADKERDDRERERAQREATTTATPERPTSTSSTTPSKTVRVELSTGRGTIPVTVDASKADDLIELLKELQLRS
jgi:TP901 family phage tail tape measure protein